MLTACSRYEFKKGEENGTIQSKVDNTRLKWMPQFH